MLSNESEWIAQLTKRLGQLPDDQVGIGDDAALVKLGSSELLLAADTLVEGVHADLRLTTPADLGWKALAVNVSDMAAMGARVCHALVSVVVPKGRGADLDAVYVGLEEAAGAFHCAIVGGDLSVGPALVVTVAVTGVIDDGGPGPVLRSAARSGDHLFVTGPLGAAAFGLRMLSAGHADPAGVHGRPIPRVEHGSASRRAGATAMIDLSDGLAMDARRLASASGVGFELDEIPIADGATIEEAIGGGDDYELLIAVGDPRGLVAGFQAAGLEPPLRIGICTDQPGRYLLGGVELPAGGWEHRW